MLCIKCGIQLPDESKFCSNCGYDLKSDDKPQKSLSKNKSEKGFWKDILIIGSIFIIIWSVIGFIFGNISIPIIVVGLFAIVLEWSIGERIDKNIGIILGIILILLGISIFIGISIIVYSIKTKRIE